MAVVGGLHPSPAAGTGIVFHGNALAVPAAPQKQEQQQRRRRKERIEAAVRLNRAERRSPARSGERWICGSSRTENGAASAKDRSSAPRWRRNWMEEGLEESLRSIEGGEEFDAELAEEHSRDSSEGLVPAQGDDAAGGSKFTDFERKRDASLNSIEGLTTDEAEEEKKRQAAEEEARNAEWRNVFPAYMQSREDEEYREEDFDAAAVEEGRRQEAAERAGGPKTAAMAAAEAFNSQVGGEDGASPAAALSDSSPTMARAAAAVSGGGESNLKSLVARDPIWAAIRAEARLEAEREPLLSSFLYASILAHGCLERSIGFVLANRLKNATLLATQLLDVFDDVFMRDAGVRQAIRADVQAVRDRDPACSSYSLALLYLKGYHALQAYRVAHALWNRGQRVLAHALQSRISEVLAVDIHPAARIGKAILLDHGTGVVIGETAVVGDRVSMLHGVTLGGTGKAAGDRHPKIREGVLIGAGATILGNIVVGKGAMVAAGSLVLKDVPPHSMVAGTPARVVNYLDESSPSLTMKQDAPKGFCEGVLESALDGGAGI